MDDAAAALAAARDGAAGLLRFGAVPTANAALVPRALARLEAQHPDVELRLREVAAELGSATNGTLVG
jgi:DNA-binding transcriptional LysR family regulator